MRTLLVICIVMMLPCAALAKTETVFATFRYTLGDNDSKNDAKRIAFIEAKRLAVDQAGVLLQSSTEVTDSALTKDEIKSYTGAILKVSVDKEAFEPNGTTQTLVMTVKADVDTSEIKQTLLRIRNDKGLQQQIADQQKRLAELEKKLSDIQKNLYSTKNADTAMALRENRAQIVSEIDELAKLQQKLQINSDNVMKFIREGMTYDEMYNILGSPRAVVHGNDTCYNYGKYWIVVKDKFVRGYLLERSFWACGDIGYYALKHFEALMPPENQ